MTKPVIFLVHGYNGIPKIFNYFKDEFEKADYEVVLPQFPTQTEITQERYFSVFDEYKDKIGENTIIIAHSIGNIMAMKYLSENDIAIRGYVSLAGFGEPFIMEGRDDLNAVVAPLRLDENELAKLPGLIGKAYSIYSDSDHVVPYEVLEKYPKILGAKACPIPGVGHMGSKSGLEEFPEVVEIVKEIIYN